EVDELPLDRRPARATAGLLRSMLCHDITSYCRNLREATARDHARGIGVQWLAIVVAPELVEHESISLQQNLKLAWEDKGQIEGAFLAVLLPARVEPAVVESDRLKLLAGVAADVHVHEDGAVQRWHVEDRAVDPLGDVRRHQ